MLNEMKDKPVNDWPVTEGHMGVTIRKYGKDKYVGDGIRKNWKTLQRYRYRQSVTKEYLFYTENSNGIVRGSGDRIVLMTDQIYGEI